MEPDKSLWVGTVEELKRKGVLERYRIHDYDLSSKYCCHVCGKPFEPAELAVLMDFSFCGEYSCGLMMHLKCPRIEELVKKWKVDVEAPIDGRV